MQKLQKLIIPVAEILGRFHQWGPVQFVMGHLGPFHQWSDEQKVRFAYACVMSADDPRTRNIVANLVRRERDESAYTNLWLARVCWHMGAIRLARMLYLRAERLPCSRIESELATCLGEVAQGIQDGTIYQTIATAVDALQLAEPAAGPLVVTAVSSRFIDMFELWNAQIEKHLARQIPCSLLLLALDKTAVTGLRNSAAAPSGVSESVPGNVLDLSRYFAFSDDGLMDPLCKSNLWILRVLILRELALRGYMIYSLDLDAIAVGDLPGLMTSLQDFDIVAQIDTSYPLDVVRKLGFTICCGFVAIRPGAAVNGFFTHYVERVIREMDDQQALNHLLVEHRLRLELTTPACKSFNLLGLNWALPDKSIISRDIRYGSVIRHFGQHGETIDDLKRGLGIS